MVSKTIPVQPFDLVVFGATGDLAKRKIIPALFRRFIAGQIPDVSRILGISRQELSSKEYSVMVVDFIKEFVPANVYDQNDVVKFCKMITFLSVDLKSDKGWKELEKFFDSNSNQIRTFYLSISPSLIDSCSKKLNDYALITANTRVVVEKPLGTDLPSAKMLNDTLRRVFNEKQIFRIDHYLGKETVQNLMAIEDQLGTRYFPIHRLDRKTSGIILLATKKEYVSTFQALFTNKKIKKIYYGVVRGYSQDNRIIDSPVKGRDALVYKEAETHLNCLDKIELNISVKPYDSSRYSLVELTPITGRMHQLRIHMNKLSTPLINDTKYGDKNHNTMYGDQFGWINLFLHAGSLAFTHPFTNQELVLKSSFSDDWIQLFEKFSWKNPLK